MITSVVKADGAGLYAGRRGDGPPLLMIAGGGGDGGALTTLAGILAASCTVITYDRRGNSRSPLYHDPVKITIAGQSADAAAVLRASGFDPARIFGNSGGAIIALDLAARHPHAAAVVVAHEPPLPRVLPDASQYLDVYDEIDRTLRAEGWEAAFTIFQSRAGHVPPGQLPATMAVLLRPERADLRHDPFHRPCTAIAARLGAEFAEFPGGHLAPMELPAPFAAGLRDVFGRL